jgi:hypothetical protein
MSQKNHPFLKYLLLVVGFSFGIINQGLGQEDRSVFYPFTDTIRSAFDLFEEDEPLNISLKYDISTFIRRKVKSEYLPAELTIHFSEKDSLSKQIRLRSRGNYRKTECYFPPIMLNFKTDTTKKTNITSLSKLKLVTPCNTSKTYQQFIFLEYLAYRIYNLLSTHSFKVRLVHIHYIDTGKKKHNFTRTGFLIEPIKQLTNRVFAIRMEDKYYHSSLFYPDDTDRMALFQYMIGNDDWYLKAYHNVKFIKRLDIEEQLITPIPYDFDHAGIVDAFYAMPQKWVSVKSITDREYMGFCRDRQTYQIMIEDFNSHRSEIFQLIEDCPYLDAKNKKITRKYIEDFYKLAANPKALIFEMERTCQEPY